MDRKEFLAGKAMDAYEFFGAHPTGKGTVFRVYAPGAAGVTVMGDWTGWKEISMDREADGVFTKWEEFAYPGHIYKYVIYGRNGSRVEKSDPYGFLTELRPGAGSVMYPCPRGTQCRQFRRRSGKSAGKRRSGRLKA